MPTNLREYKSLRILLAGGVLDLDGLKLVKDDGEIFPGDLYIGERNTGPQLLTCHSWSDDGSYVFPTTCDYPYNWDEVVKVKEFISE